MNSTLRNIFHYGITALILLGGLFITNCTWLKFHIFLCGNVILHWLTNNNHCFLSEYDYDSENGYTAHLLSKIGIHIAEDNNLVANAVSYGSVLFVLFISWWRLSSVCKNEVLAAD